MIEWRDLQRIAREARQAIGIERTPEQVNQFLASTTRRPLTLVRAALADPDIMLDLANRMRIPFLDNSPPSTELLQ